MRKCIFDYEAKIYEALLVKRQSPSLKNNAMQVELHFCYTYKILTSHSIFGLFT